MGSAHPHPYNVPQSRRLHPDYAPRCHMLLQFCQEPSQDGNFRLKRLLFKDLEPICAWKPSKTMPAVCEKRSMSRTIASCSWMEMPICCHHGPSRCIRALCRHAGIDRSSTCTSPVAATSAHRGHSPSMTLSTISVPTPACSASSISRGDLLFP